MEWENRREGGENPREGGGDSQGGRGRFPGRVWENPREGGGEPPGREWKNPREGAEEPQEGSGKSSETSFYYFFIMTAQTTIIYSYTKWSSHNIVVNNVDLLSQYIYIIILIIHTELVV